MELRRATATDVEPALEVWRAALAGRGTRPPAARVARVRDKLGAPDAVLVVAVDGELVRGFALGEWGRRDQGAGELEPGLLHLALLAVHPVVQRQGVGEALAEALADAGYLRGARRLAAWPRATDTAARGFLAAVGLEPTGTSHPAAGGEEVVQHLGELEPPLRELEVRESGLRLGQMLKLAGLVETGAEGKALLEAGGVEVDGEVEHRRGRQLRSGEVVVARDQAVRVVLPAE